MLELETVKVSQQTLTKIAELLKPLTAPVVYPESDGEPMAETDTHRDEMTDSLIHPLKEHYRYDPQVYVSGNLLLYYEEGNPQASVAPDVFVVFGVENHQRRTYKIWQEGKGPDVVFELTSDSTRSNDLKQKRLLYEQLGVREYFLFDPLREYMEPPLQGFRLVGNYYTPLTPKHDNQDNWELYSEVLGLFLRTDGVTLRLFDPRSGKYLLTRAQESVARRQAEAQAEKEATARRQAEAQAEKEATARRQAETRLRQAEAELARLRAQLAQQNPD